MPGSRRNFATAADVRRGRRCRKPVHLKLDGKSFVACGKATARIVAFLQGLPPDELRTTRELALAVKLAYHSLWNVVHDPALSGYREIVPPRRRVWGSRPAIAELRRQMRVAG